VTQLVESAVIQKYGVSSDEEGSVSEVPTGEFNQFSSEFWNERYFITNRILQGIRKRSLADQNATFDDLSSLLFREDFVFQAITSLRPNKGIGTSGVDNANLDGASSFDVRSLVEELKSRSFKFLPVRRIMVPKPGKPEKRPLGIPTFRDRVVQEMIRSILEAIYEPVFQKTHQNVNYGFREGFSTHDAIDRIQAQAQNTEWCIEGDIKGAYDNVNHEKLLNILRERIKDESFLYLIDLGLKLAR
jgi:retron-type reverse transcriptase